MRISLDYDKTYTLGPAFWDDFCRRATAAGHEVVCVTMRRDTPSERVEMPCRVVYTARRAKAEFASENGLGIDVWIDDSPWWLLNDG